MKRRKVHLQAPAKINLFLEVLGRRPDGYHEIHSILHAISLCDDVQIEERKQGIKVICSDPSIPPDERNLAWRAAAVIQQEAKTTVGVNIHLKKRIPVGAGLGGGSSDAAAVLLGLNDLWQLGLPEKELRRLAAQIGSDCPFFISKGTAVCEGRGEIVRPLAISARFCFLLLCPPASVSTAQVYRNLTGKDLTGPRHSDKLLCKELERGDIAGIGKQFFNRLERPAFRLFSALRAAKERFRAVCPRGVLMSGSGSALFGILDRTEVGDALKQSKVLGLKTVVAVESWVPGLATRVKGGGSGEHNRSAGSANGALERPAQGLLQHHD